MKTVQVAWQMLPVFNRTCTYISYNAYYDEDFRIDKMAYVISLFDLLHYNTFDPSEKNLLILFFCI